ncbi:MAG TPA: DUF6056 family protein [Candidatus Saccharibacteria bacterium]|jgi:hypothetical protein|nr:DUF6056 family protein [Candidatus Saccharibacteria bacterium]
MRLKKYISVLTIVALFALPILFFAIVYFLQVVSSEDIFQGAGRPVSIINDAINAFHWSARLSDMYAWLVINFFDYTFKFGIDTIFRLVDVTLAAGIFYVMGVIVLDRRPRLEIRDALLFGISFLALFLSDYSRSLITSFSHIHNYLLITLLSLLFLLPFVRQLRGKYLSPRPITKFMMLVIGFLFAFSSNVTPATFIITAGLVNSYDRLAQRRTFNFNKILHSWQIFAVAGMLVAMFVVYVIGPGFSSYTHGYNSSYVSIKSLISTPLATGAALVGNMAHNFQLAASALLMMLLVVLVEYVIARKKLIPKHKEPIAGIGFSAIALLFFIVHILAVSQIDVPASKMTRILLPAYICVIVSVLFTVNRLVILADIKKKTLFLLAIPVILLTSVITADIGAVMVQHRQQASIVLERIKHTEGKDVCVTQADEPTAKSPILKYYQAKLFIDWSMPATIYNKQVDWCK